MSDERGSTADRRSERAIASGVPFLKTYQNFQ